VNIQLALTPKEIELLRQAMDSLPLRPYAPIICKVLLALPIFDLPESAARTPSGADADLRAHTLPVSPGGGFFTLHALTPQGEAKLPEIEALLAPLLGLEKMQ
jgi:hypothetical protein